MLLDLTPLTAWSDFYMIVGSASAALTGLQFVVVALAADRKTITQEGARTFATPTIAHFCAVLLVSALFSAPWHHLFWPAVGTGLCGIFGLVYGAFIFRQALHHTDYHPVLEDWIWHIAIPMIVYAGDLAAAFFLTSRPQHTLFTIGMLQIVLLLAGIHNAWDSAIYIAVDSNPASKPSDHHKR